MVRDYQKILDSDGLPHSNCIRSHYKLNFLFYDDTWKSYLLKMPDVKKNLEKGICVKFNEDIETYTKHKAELLLPVMSEEFLLNTYIVIGTKSMLYYGNETEVSIISTKLHSSNYDSLLRETEDLYIYNTTILNKYNNWFGRTAEYYNKRY